MYRSPTISTTEHYIAHIQHIGALSLSVFAPIWRVAHHIFRCQRLDELAVGRKVSAPAARALLHVEPNHAKADVVAVQNVGFMDVSTLTMHASKYLRHVACGKYASHTAEIWVR